ncbi:MAG TPA: hypothetical protein VJB08_03770 [Candidatus Nanoarchaeia archaeon]|nr:hypothetical protein [Candidatus Nanoarchaeia archaeon]
MEPRNIFQDMVEYHVTNNLEACLGFIEDGKIISPEKKRPYRPGLDENHIYAGFLLVSDGNRLLDALVKDKRVTPSPEHMSEFQSLDGKDGSLFEYFDSLANTDGVFIYDSLDDKVARVYEMGNEDKKSSFETAKSYLASLAGCKSAKSTIKEDLPADFCSYDGSVPLQGNIGTKTRLAIKLPKIYGGINAQAFQIKHTPYTDFGMGKVTHFGKDGLKEEFFLMHERSAINPENPHGIIGVYRQYAKIDGKLGRTIETRTPLPILYETGSYTQPDQTKRQNAA